MLINAFIVALSHLHVRWENKRYERSRWMIVGALIGLAIQYVLQMTNPDNPTASNQKYKKVNKR